MTDFSNLREADYRIQVELASKPSRSDPATGELHALADKLAETLTRLAPIVIDGYVAKESRQFGQLVDLMLGDLGPTPVDIAKARMKASALRAVFVGTEWLTAAQISHLAGLGVANPSGTVNRWKKRRKVFTLEHDGQDRYPSYLLGDDFRPLVAAERVLQALAGFDAKRLASWFESRTGLLGGQRPRELLASEPERVIEAARRTLDAELHAA